MQKHIIQRRVVIQCLVMVDRAVGKALAGLYGYVVFKYLARFPFVVVYNVVYRHIVDEYAVFHVDERLIVAVRKSVAPYLIRMAALLFGYKAERSIYKLRGYEQYQQQIRLSIFPYFLSNIFHSNTPYNSVHIIITIK